MLIVYSRNYEHVLSTINNTQRSINQSQQAQAAELKKIKILALAGL